MHRRSQQSISKTQKITDAFLQFVLIMAGVLAALLLNNIQTKNKRELSEAQMLTELATSLREDANELDALYNSHQHALMACQIVWSNLRNGDGWNDSLMRYIIEGGNQYIFIPQSAAFESYKTAGISLIKNNGIRIALFRVYEESFALVKILDTEYGQYIYQYWLPFIIKNFRSGDAMFDFSPYDPDMIAQGPDIFIQMRILQIRHQNAGISVAAAALDAHFLVRQIEFELLRIEKNKRKNTDERDVEFTLPGNQQAQHVYVCGTFNRWAETELALKKNNDGWQITIPLQPGVYMYKFIVDGNWIEDPNNPDKIQNQFLTFNSVKEVW